ncbi:hypothetical protein NHX12_012391 [Muraenolepis orangiensis]|uniref:Uncharacterized protein n=1 Tax=Muraenolepis orangiensis TaxID=630683 RepID=A0A9Q0DCM3_9TELE|nr:hypothetical protein NHX12_012391 [Muraenolepis orangiensis]
MEIDKPGDRGGVSDSRTVNTGGHGPGGACHLAGEAGALHCLGALLDLVLVAAAMGSDHLARPCLDVD